METQFDSLKADPAKKDAPETKLLEQQITQLKEEVARLTKANEDLTKSSKQLEERHKQLEAAIKEIDERLKLLDSGAAKVQEYFEKARATLAANKFTQEFSWKKDGIIPQLDGSVVIKEPSDFLVKFLQQPDKLPGIAKNEHNELVLTKEQLTKLGLPSAAEGVK